MKKDSFWGRVKQLLKAHNLTQNQFAKVTRFSPNTVRGWIYHDRVPELTAAYVIAHSLGVSLEYLLSGKDKDITELRLKELEMRKAAARILKMIDEIQKEIKVMRPIAEKWAK